MEIEPKLKEYQIMFKLIALNENTEINDNIITSISSRGPYKNVYGDFDLLPHNKYSFSFRIINALICKIGIIKKDKLEEKKKTFQETFSDFPEGFALFSNGNTRNGSKNDINSQKFCRPFCLGDIISVFFDGKNGILEYYLNGKFCGRFMEFVFSENIYVPIIALQGDDEKLMLTCFQN